MDRNDLIKAIKEFVETGVRPKELPVDQAQNDQKEAAARMLGAEVILGTAENNCLHEQEKHVEAREVAAQLMLKLGMLDREGMVLVILDIAKLFNALMYDMWGSWEKVVEALIEPGIPLWPGQTEATPEDVASVTALFESLTRPE
jgi:hypothetical protein